MTAPLCCRVFTRCPVHADPRPTWSELAAMAHREAVRTGKRQSLRRNERGGWQIREADMQEARA